MLKRFLLPVSLFLLVAGNERCKTFAGASPSTSVWTAINTDREFSILKDLMIQSGWSEKLNDRNSQYTVFAPNNAAFEKLGADRLQALRQDNSREALESLIGNHIFQGSLDKEELINKGTTPASFSGKSFPVQQKQGRWYIGNAHAIRNPVFAKNGMLYAVEDVME